MFALLGSCYSIVSLKEDLLSTSPGVDDAAGHGYREVLLVGAWKRRANGFTDIAADIFEVLDSACHVENLWKVLGFV